MGPGSVLGKAGLVTLIGFLAVVLCWEVIVLASIAIYGLIMLAPFFLVGLAIWLPWHWIWMTRTEADWRQVRTLGTRYRLMLRRIGRILLETLSGALVGGFLGALSGLNHHDAELALPIGILIGGLIGLLVGARNHPLRAF